MNTPSSCCEDVSHGCAATPDAPFGVLTGQHVLVIGGTGSLGHAFIRRAVTGEWGVCRSLTVLSRDEAKQYEMKREFPSVYFRLGDVRNYEDVYTAMQDIDIVINAAALKQVPSCEYNPYQAVLTNCFGTQNIVRAASAHTPHTVVTISTDKACKPTTVMGMTKALQERIAIAANLDNPCTRFVCVRYGNVLVSRGSVIPLFKEQIDAGGPVTVTVPTMTRFLLTLDQAVDTMIAALSCGRAGEIYVPQAQSATIHAIAKTLIGDRPIDIRSTGIRPGEKHDEIMISEEETAHTVERDEYYVILPVLPELKRVPAVGGVTFWGEYSSAKELMDPWELKEMLEAA